MRSTNDPVADLIRKVGLDWPEANFSIAEISRHSGILSSKYVANCFGSAKRDCLQFFSVNLVVLHGVYCAVPASAFRTDRRINTNQIL